MTQRENMKLVWEHKQPAWVPAVNLASQMLVLPELNDRPLFQDGTDWFGIDWKLDPDHPELMTHVRLGQCLFDDITSWREHVAFPSCKDLDWNAIAGRTAGMWTQKDEKMGYVVGQIGAFERINALMGFENGLCALYEEPDACADFARAYADYRIEQFGYIKRFMDADFLMMHDDWGNQRNMFMPPEIWRRVFKEPERRMAAACHQLGMYYMHHSCGYIEPIVGDLVEIGVDSWHSVQPVNDLPRLKRQYGDRLVFAGGIDPQVTDAPGATEESIRGEVRRAIDVLGAGGGFLASSAVMFSCVPGVDDIIEDEVTRYGRYSEAAS